MRQFYHANTSIICVPNRLVFQIRSRCFVWDAMPFFVRLSSHFWTRHRSILVCWLTSFRTNTKINPCGCIERWTTREPMYISIWHHTYPFKYEKFSIHNVAERMSSWTVIYMPGLGGMQEASLWQAVLFVFLWGFFSLVFLPNQANRHRNNT